MTVAYLDVASLKTYLRITQADTLDDEVLQTIVLAVMAEQVARLIPSAFDVPQVNPLIVGGEPVPKVADDVYQAALQRGARLYARRASPEGLVGLGELGVARIPPYDKDIDALEAPWRAVVLA